MSGKGNEIKRLEGCIDLIYSVALQAGEIPQQMTEEEAKSLMRRADTRKIKRVLATALKAKAHLEHQEKTAARR
jgi:hypothetical protein